MQLTQQGNTGAARRWSTAGSVVAFALAAWAYLWLSGRFPFYFIWDMNLATVLDVIVLRSGLHPDHVNHPGFGMYLVLDLWIRLTQALASSMSPLACVAELTVMPEELPYFLTALAAGTGDFINGSRMIYPMRNMALKFANFVGNKIFSLMFSLLFGHYIKDTLCGTKVLYREDFARLKPLIGTWGIKDLWGDYDLLFGASKQHLVIHDLPVHYQERLHGVTKMRRVFWNGWRMLRMWWTAWRKLRQSYY